MSGDDVGRAVGVELADARAHHRRARQGDHPSNGVDDARPGEVDGPLTQGQIAQPPVAPDPMPIYRVYHGAHDELYARYAFI